VTIDTRCSPDNRQDGKTNSQIMFLFLQLRRRDHVRLNSSQRSRRPMIRAGLAALVTAIVLPGNGWAEGFYNGDQLFEACKSSRAACIGYVEGVSDVMAAMQEKGMTLGGWRACVPTGEEAGQITDVAQQYLADHPERRQYGAVGLVAQALQEAFPCPP
jgi:hypothetical protein